MAVGERTDPYRNFNFTVEIDGVTLAGFSEASGLDLEMDIVEYREGNDPRMSVRKLSGLRKYTNIVLKRGYTDNTELFDLFRIGQNGSVARRNGAVVMLDEDRNPIYRWEFEEGWVYKYTSAQFNASASEVAIESIEIAYEFLQVVRP